MIEALGRKDPFTDRRKDEVKDGSSVLRHRPPSRKGDAIGTEAGVPRGGDGLLDLLHTGNGWDHVIRNRKRVVTVVNIRRDALLGLGPLGPNPRPVASAKLGHPIGVRGGVYVHVLPKGRQTCPDAGKGESDLIKGLVGRDSGGRMSAGVPDLNFGITEEKIDARPNLDRRPETRVVAKKNERRRRVGSAETAKRLDQKGELGRVRSKAFGNLTQVTTDIGRSVKHASLQARVNVKGTTGVKVDDNIQPPDLEVLLEVWVLSNPLWDAGATLALTGDGGVSEGNWEMVRDADGATIDVRHSDIRLEGP
jgi:hypothetical protein